MRAPATARMLCLACRARLPRPRPDGGPCRLMGLWCSSGAGTAQAAARPRLPHMAAAALAAPAA